MHNGKFNKLKDVLEFYEDISSGNSQSPLVSNEDLDTWIKRIDIKVKNMGSIISFFNTLNNDDFDRRIPQSVVSNLSVGGDIQ